jgi:HAD superfamily hydrolase (TIGR01509 family)
MVVREAARILRIPLEEIAVVGDMANDVPMLNIAGLGIAMGNASPEVQRVARHVTASNAEEGFAHAVDAFILGGPPLARTPLGLPPRTRACLFGLDGVLAQIDKMRAEAWGLLLDRYLGERARETGQTLEAFDPARDYRQHFRGVAPLDALRSFLDSRGIEVPHHTLQAMAERRRAILVDLYGRQRVETYEGSIRYLRAVRDAGLRTAVISSSTSCAEALASAGIADLFDACIDGSVAQHENLESPPAPDMFLAAARALGVENEEAVVFDDALAGVEAARAGHFGYVVGVDRHGQAAELRRHGADLVVPDLVSLLSPDGPATHAS